MRIKIRLKGIKDVDLLCLHQTPGYFLERAMQTALYAYVERRKLTLPCPIAPQTLDLSERFIYVTVSDDRADVLDFLSSLPPGSKTTVLKLIIRNALQEPFIDYLSSGETTFFTDKAEEAEEEDQKTRQTNRRAAPRKQETVNVQAVPSASKPDPKKKEEVKESDSISAQEKQEKPKPAKEPSKAPAAQERDDDFGFISIY